MEPNVLKIEFQGDMKELSEEIREKVSRRVHKLASGNQDISGATLSIQQLGKDNAAPDVKARLTITRRGGPVVATEHAPGLQAAVVAALEGAERQVRDLRDRNRSRRRAPKDLLS